MKQKQDRIEQRRSLRREAESMVARFYPKEMMSENAEKLLHELMVHKVELELQNEELRTAYATMAEIRDHYLELYEFAPVGYITINHEGLISEANRLGCSLLNIHHSKLIDQRFSKFIATRNGDHWHQIFLNMLKNASQVNDHNLEMIDNDGASFSAHLVCSSRKSKDNMPLLQVAFTNWCYALT